MRLSDAGLRDAISIHALREEGDLTVFAALAQLERISIHALREEGDCYVLAHGQKVSYFYPRPPRGGRLFNNGDKTVTRPISIHALREEGD